MFVFHFIQLFRCSDRLFIFYQTLKLKNKQQSKKFFLFFTFIINFDFLWFLDQLLWYSLILWSICVNKWYYLLFYWYRYSTRSKPLCFIFYFFSSLVLFVIVLLFLCLRNFHHHHCSSRSFRWLKMMQDGWKKRSPRCAIHNKHYFHLYSYNV